MMGGAQAVVEALGLLDGLLPISKQTKPFEAFHVSSGFLSLHFYGSLKHAVERESLQLVKGGIW